MKLTEESQALYKEYGVNPYATMLPLVVQLPILMALYQALTRVAFLKTGTFLWIELSKPDPYFYFACFSRFVHIPFILVNKQSSA